MSNSFFKSQIKKHSAIRVRTKTSTEIQGMQGQHAIPHIRDAPKDKAIWYETRNFGWIFGPVQNHQGRKLLLKY